jgi:putative phosphoesterase
MRIGLISDTHSYYDDKIDRLFAEVDEIWHAGDFGNHEIGLRLEALKPLRAVYGNIDGKEIRAAHPLHQRFVLEGVKVWMTHIGGYPGRWPERIREELARNPPNLFICGHSHIVKVARDKTYNVLAVNPGAAGREGFHRVRTIMRFDLNAGKIEKMELIELGPQTKGL